MNFCDVVLVISLPVFMLVMKLGFLFYIVKDSVFPILNISFVL